MIKYNSIKYLISTICIILFFLCFAQNGQTQEQENYLIKGSFEKVRVDDFGNIYTLDNQATLRRYDKNLKLLFEYSFNGIGMIGDFDVSNPQKLLLFFSDYQIIIFLDNTLSEIKRLKLEDFAFWNITSIALSPDNFIWLYDPINFKIIKIEESGRELYSSNESYFGKLSNEMKPRISANLHFIVCYTDSEYMIFDNFGQLLKSVQYTNNKISLKDRSLVIQIDNKLVIEPVKSNFSQFEEVLYQQKNTIIDFHLTKNNKLYILDEKGLKQVQIN